jgi:hypothetical protein
MIRCAPLSYLSISGATLVAYYTLYRFDERPSYYNSPAGLALVALRVLATGWFDSGILRGGGGSWRLLCAW